MKKLISFSALIFLCRLALALGVCAALTTVCEVFVVQPAFDAGSLDLGFRLLVASATGFIGFFVVTAGVFRMQEITLLLRLLKKKYPR